MGTEIMQSGLRCSMCTSSTSWYCCTCKRITYCSQTCAKADWPLHHLICKPPLPRPPDMPITSYKGILFPENDPAPESVTFGWRSYNTENRDDKVDYYHCDDHDEYDPYHPARHLLGFDNPAGTIIITGNALRSRILTGYKIEVYYNDKPPTDGSGLNRSILAATNGRRMQNWHGPLLAVKVLTPPPKPYSWSSSLPHYLSMDLLDLRDVVDLLSTFPAADINDMTTAGSTASPKAEVPAIRINSLGDQALGRPKFEALQIRADNPACLAPVTGISRLIGLPIRVLRVPPPFPPEYDDPGHDMSNLAATYLHIGVDPTRSWGFVGLDWVDQPGSVIVVHEGGEALKSQHLEALCHWCLFVLRPLFEDSLGMGRHLGDPIEKVEVPARVTRREYVDFYVGFDEWKGGVDPGWKKGQRPFQ